MNVHEKYYGKAVEEIAGGGRRDDLWAKALALAEGDTKKAQAIYVDLLARLFSEEASTEKSRQRNTVAISAARKIVTFVARLFVWIALVGGTIAAFVAAIDYMKNEYAKELARNTVPENQEIIPYYNVVLAIEQGEEYGEVPEDVLDSFRLTYFGLLEKYEYNSLIAGRFSYNKDQAEQIYNSIIANPTGWPEDAVMKYPLEWVLLVLAFLGILFGITLVVLKYPFEKTSSTGEVSPNNSLQARRP